MGWMMFKFWSVYFPNLEWTRSDVIPTLPPQVPGFATIAFWILAT